MQVHGACLEFTPKLIEVYKKLKEKGENFEIVLIPLDYEDEHFKEGLKTMPWLTVPFKDKTCEKLPRYFELKTIPTVVIIGPDGKTLHPNVAELIEEHGIEAYPFTPDKVDELAEIEKARFESQTLESILILGESDFVIDKSGSKVRFMLIFNFARYLDGCCLLCFQIGGAMVLLIYCKLMFC